jgi:hypothetical protein
VSVDEPKDYGICRNCNERAAIGKWVGNGSVMDLVHGNYTYWCEPCMLRAQIEHAREAAERLPELEARLAKLAPRP